MTASPAEQSGRLAEAVRYFLTLGFIAFGGPAAHIALMRRDLVQRRKWVTDQEFVDLLGITNLIPGPNSTEMTMHLGAQRAGWRGLWLGGAAFILPAVAIVLVLAWAYVEYGDTPTGEALIYGIQPFILAVVAQAIWGLRTAAIKSWETAVLAGVVVGLALLGMNEVILILGAGLLMLLYRLARASGARGRQTTFGLITFASTPPGYSLLELFLVFLKIGSVLYGSGYVLLAFLESDFIDSRGWLTEQQLVDAIAVGQFTPGPVFSSATFVGYIIDGVPGAMVATLGIFIPSFIFVNLTHPLIPRLRRSTWAAPFLDGVNAAALALMAVVTVTLGREVLDDWYTAALFALAAIVLIRFNPNSAWLVIAGAAAGLLHAAAT